MLAVELGLADSGGSRTARIGETLVISLAENPTTGYRWQLATDELLLQIVDDRFEAASDLRGAPGVRVLTLRTLRAGHTSLALERRRAWESTAVQSFTLELTIA